MKVNWMMTVDWWWKLIDDESWSSITNERTNKLTTLTLESLRDWKWKIYCNFLSKLQTSSGTFKYFASCIILDILLWIIHKVISVFSISHVNSSAHWHCFSVTLIDSSYYNKTKAVDCGCAQAWLETIRFPQIVKLGPQSYNL